MIKSIELTVEIKGSGIVNFDSNDQKYLWNLLDNVEKVRHDNVMFGKGRYYKQEIQGKTVYTKVPVISADCFRHTIWSDTMPVHLPNIMHNDIILLRAIATPSYLERGWLFAREKSTWKRKSPVLTTYVKAVEHSAPAIETYSNSQQKQGVEKSEEASENSFFKKEVLGDCTYLTKVVIDLNELGFVSMSDVHDRYSLDSDYEKTFRDILGERLGSVVEPAAFFMKENSCYEIPEYGIKLTEEQVKFLAVDVVKRVCRFNLMRTTSGSAATSKVTAKFISNPLEITDEHVIFDGAKINLDVINSINVHSFYRPVESLEAAKAEVESYREKYGYVKKKKDPKEKKTKKEAKEADEV